jgi:hypothetical protein
MKYDAVAFLEGLFRHPGGGPGMDAGVGPDVNVGVVAEERTEPGHIVADLPPDWHLLWDERAAIMEYDGGLPRERAEALALADILGQMRRVSNLTGNGACN